MKLSFFGAIRRVTGSNYLLEADGRKIIIDCGLFQGSSADRGKNQEPFTYNPREVDAVIITHSHIDHIGRVPKLVRDGFVGTIYSTIPVKEFASVFLDDTLHILKDNARRHKSPLIWERRDLQSTMKLWEGKKYYEKFNIGNIEIEFFDAGHILGSAVVRITAEEKTVVFSGDLGNPPVPLLKPIDIIGNVDYLITESTYGDRLHEGTMKRKMKLERTIEDIDSQKGALLIPAFAMERTQELLYEINDLVENHRIREIPIFMDSPLAIKATEIFKRYEDYFNKEAQYLINSGDNIFDFPGLKITRTTQESKAIAGVQKPKVIIAGSGMSTGGRILAHEKKYLSDPNNIILFIGFQVRGTLGRRIKDGEKFVRIAGQDVEIKAEVREIAGYSAHADQNKLVEWIEKTNTKSQKLKKVFITHGELKPGETLAKKIKEKANISCYIPKDGESIKL